jgi:hypothetical protein
MRNLKMSLMTSKQENNDTVAQTASNVSSTSKTTCFAIVYSRCDGEVRLFHTVDHMLLLVLANRMGPLMLSCSFFSM